MKIGYVSGLVFAVAFSLVSGCSTVMACQTEECAVDSKISNEVEKRLMEHPALATGNIRIETVHRVVYLHGPVDTRVEQSLALELAHVPEAVDVVDGLYVMN